MVASAVQVAKRALLATMRAAGILTGGIGGKTGSWVGTLASAFRKAATKVHVILEVGLHPP